MLANDARSRAAIRRWCLPIGRLVRVLTCLALLSFSKALGDGYDLIIEPKTPQADSREELDLYLDILQQKDPKKAIEEAANFVHRYPASEFLPQVHRMEMRNYQMLDDAENSVRAGNKLLGNRPRDVEALLTLAKVLPRTKGDKEENLKSAENYARLALQEIAALRAPRMVSINAFERAIFQMRSGAHEALGVIAFQREQYVQSAAEFETSITLHPAADGSLYYRLGVAYRYVDNRTKAEAALRRAAELGPTFIRELARTQLTELQHSPVVSEK